MSITRVAGHMVELDSGRTLESKLDDITSAVDYGASIASSAATNTASLNSAITAAAASGGSGIVLVSPGISYTEGDLSIPDGVVVLVLSTSGTALYLTKDQGSTLPVTKGGIIVKGQGNTGILLRALDYGVTAEPVLQVVNASTGNLAILECKFAEISEISTPTAPSANKARVYLDDDGSGNTRLMAMFATGSALPIATQGRNPNLVGTATYDPGSLADGAGVSTNVTVTGAALGDIVVTSFSLDLQGITLSSYVSSANTVTVRFQNESGGVLDLASGTLKSVVIRNY